eukprot:111800-Amphidinium_carterae.1
MLRIPTTGARSHGCVPHVLARGPVHDASHAHAESAVALEGANERVNEVFADVSIGLVVCK